MPMSTAIAASDHYVSRVREVLARLEPIESQLRALIDRARSYPRLAPGVRLHGELAGSAFADRQWLAERDGQFVQMTELLYRVAELADGRRPLAEIADRASVGTSLSLTAEHVGWLVATRLAPAGLVAAAGAPAPVARPAVGSPLALNLRLAVVGPRLIDPVARALQYLYLPPVLGLV